LEISKHQSSALGVQWSGTGDKTGINALALLPYPNSPAHYQHKIAKPSANLWDLKFLFKGQAELGTVASDLISY